jgi:hypothetical protein
MHLLQYNEPMVVNAKVMGVSFAKPAPVIFPVATF